MLATPIRWRSLVQRVKSLAYSPDGNTLASASTDQTIRFWNARTGKLIRTLEGHTGDLECIAFSPDGKQLASSSHDTTVRLWDVATGKVRHTLKGHRAEVDSVVFSPDSKTLASGSGGPEALIWLWPIAQLPK